MSILSWEVRADEIGAGRTVTFHASEGVVAALAEAIGVDRVLACSAEFRIAPTRDDAFDVAGTVTARVVQTCVVSLEPFEADISEPVKVRFAVADAVAEGSVTRGGETDDEGSSGMADTPEPIVDGRLHLGAIAQELLAPGLRG